MARHRPRRAVFATCLANAIEWYDFAIYGAMAPVLTVVFLPAGAGAAGSVTVFALFATSFLARPLGAVLVGLRADRSGHRRALAGMVLLMSGATAAIGLLPTWSAVGAAAPLALFLLRLIQGFCSGGGISTSIAFLAESAPTARWGRYGGWHTATIAMGIASGIAAAGAVSAALSTEDLESWGWRLPFLLALPLGSVGLYLRLRLDPSSAAAGVPVTSPPTLRGVWGSHAGQIRTGFVLVAVLTGSFNMWFVYLPSHLVEQHGRAMSAALACAAAGLLATAASAPVLGSLSDQVGRRALLLGGTVTLGLLVVPLYLLGTQGSWLALVVANVVVGATLGALVISAHLADSFPEGMRATGIAMSFGLATALVGGTAPLVGSLFAAAGLPLGIPIYLAVLSAAGALAALRGTSERRQLHGGFEAARDRAAGRVTRNG